MRRFPARRVPRPSSRSVPTPAGRPDGHPGRAARIRDDAVLDRARGNRVRGARRPPADRAGRARAGPDGPGRPDRGPVRATSTAPARIDRGDGDGRAGRRHDRVASASATRRRWSWAIAEGTFFACWAIPAQVLGSRIVDREHMSSAIGLSMLPSGIGSSLGGLSGGIILQAAGPVAVFALATACLGFAAIAISGLPNLPGFGAGAGRTPGRRPAARRLALGP